jgi:hypothetical protein
MQEFPSRALQVYDLKRLSRNREGIIIAGPSVYHCGTLHIPMQELATVALIVADLQVIARKSRWYLCGQRRHSCPGGRPTTLVGSVPTPTTLYRAWHQQEPALSDPGEGGADQRHSFLVAVAHRHPLRSFRFHIILPTKPISCGAAPLN